MPNEIILAVFYFVTLLYSVIVHEVAHGVVALWLGDRTAEYADRLNLNPFKHIDLFGSIILPILMFLSAGFAFGWAKPVPYNPDNLRDQKWGPVWVALAGPLVNLIIATLAAVIARLLPLSLLAKEDVLGRFLGVIGGGGAMMDRFHLFALALAGSFGNIFFGLLLLVIFWNVVLAFFNLLPFPPLDGSKLLFALFSFKRETVYFLEQYGIFFLLLIVVFLPGPISYVIGWALSLFLGFVI